jgi:hypothetical protein
MTITDKMVYAALQAFHYGCSVGAPDPLSMKDALNAIAPLLIAQGMREAAALNANPHWQMHWDEKINAILARAQELDPQ